MTFLFVLNILNDLLKNPFDSLKEDQLGSHYKPFYLYLITDDFVKFLHVCSIHNMKAEGFQFERQRIILSTTNLAMFVSLSKQLKFADFIE